MLHLVGGAALGTFAVLLFTFGLISDWLLVRKPAMIAGALIVVAAVIFLMTADHPSYARLAIPLAFWSLGMGGGCSPWYGAGQPLSSDPESPGEQPALDAT